METIYDYLKKQVEKQPEPSFPIERIRFIMQNIYIAEAQTAIQAKDESPSNCRVFVIVMANHQLSLEYFIILFGL